MHRGGLVSLTFAQHADQARRSVRAQGAADCIHYAPSWGARADALYEVMKAWQSEEMAAGLTIDKAGSPALIADGRMVVMCERVWFFESK